VPSDGDRPQGHRRLIPIGRGQRELIIGDRHPADAIALDTILNQKPLNAQTDEKIKLYWHYVAIGQKRSTVAQFVKVPGRAGRAGIFHHRRRHAVRSGADAVHRAVHRCTMGEYFRDNGMHAVIIYDDLSSRPVAYRQMSLLLRRPPGREAYPVTCSIWHSRLLERAAKLNDEHGSGLASTAVAGDRNPGNRCLGLYPDQRDLDYRRQIYLKRSVLPGRSPGVERRPVGVRRVGSSAQTKAMKKVAGKIKGELAQYPRNGGVRTVRLRP